MADKKCWICGTSYDDLSCPACEKKKIEYESSQAKIRKTLKTLVLSTLALMSVSLVLYFLFREDEDDKLNFGMNAFVHIIKEDKYEPGVFLLSGDIAMKSSGPPGSIQFESKPQNMKIAARLADGGEKNREGNKRMTDTVTMATSLPGAVFVVDIPQGIEISGKRFEYHQIILLNSSYEYVLAPPGKKLFFTHGGTMIVPDDSRMK